MHFLDCLRIALTEEVLEAYRDILVKGIDIFGALTYAAQVYRVFVRNGFKLFHLLHQLIIFFLTSIAVSLLHKDFSRLGRS